MNQTETRKPLKGRPPGAKTVLRKSQKIALSVLAHEAEKGDVQAARDILRFTSKGVIA